MPTELLYANADLNEGTGITKVGAATSYQCIDDVRGAYDDGTTYIQLFHTSATFNHDGVQDTTTPIASVEWVNHQSRGIKEVAGAQTLNCYLRIGSTDYMIISTTETIWTTKTSGNQATNPDTSTAWDVIGVNSITVIQRTGGASGAFWTKCSGQNVQFSFTPPSGGIMWLLQGWIPPLIAAASHGVDLTMLKQFYSSRRDGGRWRIAHSKEDDFDLIKNEFISRPVLNF